MPLRRFKRAAEAELPTITLQERDRSILKLVHDHRFITTEEIMALTPGSRRNLYERLKLLFHHRYLDRIGYDLYSPMIYALANRGADILTHYYGIDRHQINWRTKNREAHHHYIHHTLMVSRFRTALLPALASLGATLTSWGRDGDVHEQVTYRDASKRLRGVIIPDASFTIEHEGREHRFYLEADRSTMTHDRYLAKLQAYYHYWLQHRRQDRGLPGFRVLTLTISPERCENLRRLAQSIDGGGRGLNLFWFLCEQDYQTTPQLLIAPIWRTPTDDISRALFARRGDVDKVPESSRLLVRS